MERETGKTEARAARRGGRGDADALEKRAAEGGMRCAPL